MCRQYIKSIV